MRVFVYLYIYVCISDEVKATGKRSFSEIQKSNSRRRDNSIKKNKKKAKQKTQASKSYVDCTYTFVTVQRERITKRIAKLERR